MQNIQPISDEIKTGESSRRAKIEDALRSNLSPCAKLVAIAIIQTGAATCRQVAELLNRNMRTTERHYADARIWLRRFAYTQDCVHTQNCGVPPADLRSSTPQKCVIEPSRARAYKELPTEVVNTSIIHPLPPKSPERTQSVREGETDLGHGVFVNCKTIRHASFAISIPAIELGTAGRFSTDHLKTRLTAHALQWAAEIENGRSPSSVVPSKIANFLCASLMGEANRDAAAPKPKESGADVLARRRKQREDALNG